jgi:hypothetical protein
MDDLNVIDYAAPGVAQRRSSRYSIASVCVSSLSLAWFIISPPIFDPAKQDRVGALGAILGILLAAAGLRQSFRKRVLAHVGMWLGVVAFLLYFLFPTL